MKHIYVTQPFLPPLEEFVPYLEKIWESKWLTNAGLFHPSLQILSKEGIKLDSLGKCHDSRPDPNIFLTPIFLFFPNIAGG